MYCPSCRSEFRAGIDFCRNCEIALVDSLPENSVFESSEAMAKSLEDKQLQPILVANHVELGKVQGVLAQQNIATLIADDRDMDAPLGVEARPKAPSLRMTSASIVGFPLESKIKRA